MGQLDEESQHQVQDVHFILPEKPVNLGRSPECWGLLEKGPATRSPDKGEAVLLKGNMYRCEEMWRPFMS